MTESNRTNMIVFTYMRHHGLFSIGIGIAACLVLVACPSDNGSGGSDGYTGILRLAGSATDLETSPLLEGETTTFTIALDTASDSDATIGYGLADGSSGSNADFILTAQANTGIEVDGESLIVGTDYVVGTTVTISWEIVDDQDEEERETIILDFSGNTDITVEGFSPTVTIYPNDGNFIGWQITDMETEESPLGGVAQLPIWLYEERATEDITLDVTVVDGAGTASTDDYGAVPSSVTIPSGSQSAMVNIPIINDNIVELGETLTLMLSGAPAPYQIDPPRIELTIISDDGAALHLNPSAITSYQEGNNARAFVWIDPQVAFDVSVTLGVVGSGANPTEASDHPSTARGTIPANSSSSSNRFSILIPITDDNIIEQEESITISIQSIDSLLPPGTIFASDATATIEYDITNNDRLSVAFADAAYSVNEGAARNTVALTVSGGILAEDASVQVTTTPGTATAGEDFIARTGNSAQVIIRADNYSTSQAISVDLDIIDNALSEFSETFEIALAEDDVRVELGAQRGATVTILDNESPPLFMAVAGERSRWAASIETYRFSVVEGSYSSGSPGSVGRVRAEPVNTYQITSGDTTLFAIDSSGQIDAIGSLDASTTDIYTLTITARNSGSPIPTTATVTIAIAEDVPQTGSAAQPYLVATGTDLQSIDSGFENAAIATPRSMDASLSANYLLTHDLDMTGFEPTGDGKGFDPIGSGEDRTFSGVFDGGGNSIDNLTIDRPDEDHVGLFTSVDNGGMVRELWLKDVDIVGGSTVAGLTATMRSTSTNRSSLHFVAVTGTINADGVVGGMIGSIGGSSGTSLLFTLFANVALPGNPSDLLKGALIGTATNPVVILNAHTAGTIVGDQSGAFIGKAISRITITNGYSRASISGGDLTGGLIGSLPFFGLSADELTPDGIYWSSQISGRSAPIGGLTAEQIGGLTEISDRTATELQALDAGATGWQMQFSPGFNLDGDSIVDDTGDIRLSVRCDLDDNGMGSDGVEDSEWIWNFGEDYPALNCLPISLEEQQAANATGD